MIPISHWLNWFSSIHLFTKLHTQIPPPEFPFNLDVSLPTEQFLIVKHCLSVDQTIEDI